MKDRSHRDAVDASSLPAACRTWDDRRRVWVAKTRYSSDKEAAAAVRKDPKQQAYRCKATSSGVHFHVGANKRGPR